ncbi:PREDICTED: NAC domain-containing protein 102-like [Ipomoea nil]|uniref:NAC domain-containing protein 102-like n=1 Tax=Ipomoea nil TaxID=35883 RepID=UPI000901959E|nr:PREDICTED: NAC domain-containing protein 102-like [Ipomoea nil]
MSNFCGSNDSAASPVEKDSGDSLRIPLGYRFYPTDEELINHFLRIKIADPSFFTTDIEEADLNRVEPGVERKRFFFCRRDMIMKYATGFWKSTGEDREIFKGKTLIGMKRSLIFYRGSERTDWVMHEYRLEGDNLPQNANEWVIGEVFLENKTYIPPYDLQTHKRKANNNGGVRQLKPKLTTHNYTTMEDGACVEVRFNNDTVMFQLPFATVDCLKAEILKRFKTFESRKYFIQYKDEDELTITIFSDPELDYCLKFFKSTGTTPVPLFLQLRESVLCQHCLFN